MSGREERGRVARAWAARAAVLLAVASALAPAPVFAQGADGAGAGMLAFADALEACEPASAEGPHPLVPNFTIQHEISGLEDGLCAYSQAMPGDMTMVCAFTEAGRAAMAEEIRASVETGEMRGGTGEQPAWASECAIVRVDGSRMEMNGPG